MKWMCVGCGQGVDAHCNPITCDERQAWCYDCAEEIDRVAKSMGGARCRNCGNSGISPWTGKPCGCPTGKALARLQADNDVEVVTPVADETNDPNNFGGKPDQDTLDAIAEAERAEAVEEAQQALAQANEPRAIIRHFGRAMERKLAANDGVKGGWRAESHRDLLRHLRSEVAELEAAVRAYYRGLPVDDLLMEACDVALLALMVSDNFGALPPTDERGR